MHSKIEIFWVTKDGILDYDSKEHLKNAHKFLYWENIGEYPAILLIGNGDYGTGYDEHTDLCICAIKHLKSSQKQIIKRMLITMKPAGAGVIKNNTIFRWSSYGFMITTPDNLKNKLEDLILPKS